MRPSRTVLAIVNALALLATGVLSPSTLHAQGAAASAKPAAAPPDFSGVYFPFTPGPRGGGGGGGARAGGGAQRGAPPPPTRSAPTGDLSQGRAANAPALNAEYLAKWEVIRKSRMSGSSEYDRIANCLLPGMPSMMNMSYGMEVLHTKDKITFFSEWMDALRRVYLDGRKPTQKILDDPTYAGYSTGHWEGDTLVVDTVALHEDSYIDGSSPHSDAMTIKERIRFIEPGVLEDRITVSDPKALSKPWETVRTYRKAAQGSDELREFACSEGLEHAK